MLFHSTLRKDLARNFAATLVVLVTIVMTVTLIRILEQANRGTVNPAEFLLVMGFSVLSQMAPLVALSLFIAVVSTLSRMYSQSEMVIWFSSGQGLAHFVRPLFRFSWPILLIVALLALLALPWSNQQSQELKQRFQKRNDFERVAPGQFQESAGGQKVFFIDKDTPDNRYGRHVFISSQEGHLESVTTAQVGRIQVTDNERFLVLDKGQQWVTNRQTGETRLIQFEHYELLIDTDGSLTPFNFSSQQTPSWQLWKKADAESTAELSWRIGLGLAGVNLVLLALALSAVNPRVGRSYHLGMALLVFVLYFNLLNVGRSWVSTGQINVLPYLLGLHGGVFALAVVWLWVRHQNWSWPFWRPALAQRGTA